MKRGETELTQEQLQLAWRHLRRPGWPLTLEEVLASPRHSPLVRGLARQFSREPKPATVRYRPPTPAGAAPLPPTPTEPPSRKQAQRTAKGDALARMAAASANRFDARRAAANDLKDD